MYELNISETRQVNGGIAPAVYGAIILGGRIAANPGVRAVVSGGAKWVGAGFGGSIGAWWGKMVIDKMSKKKKKKKGK